MSIDSAGILSIGSSSRWMDVPASVGRIEKLKKAHDAFFILEHTLGKIAAWKGITPAEERVIAALRWYGEAWKESHAPARLVKFCTCVEGLLSTGDKQGLTETLAERLSVLCFKDLKDIRDHYDETKMVYDARSKVVHGDPNASIQAAVMARRAENLARLALLAFTMLVRSFPTVRGDFEKALKKFFVTMKLGGFDAALTAAVFGGTGVTLKRQTQLMCPIHAPDRRSDTAPAA